MPEPHYIIITDDFNEEEPFEGDYILAPTGSLGSLTCVSQFGIKYVGTFHDDEQAVDHIRLLMEEEKFWPNVWEISDHGNYRLIDLAGEYPSAPPHNPQ